MAPRSELSLDFSNNNNNNCFVLEFKPRGAGTWASYDAWSSQPKELLDSEEYEEQQQQQQQQQQQKPSQRRQRLRRRRVRFATNVESATTQAYIHVSEYTPEEKQACWFRRSDYQAMRAHNAETIEKMTYRVPLLEGFEAGGEEAETRVGLETRTPMENLRCHQIMRNAIWAVLEEQDDQWRFCGGGNIALYPESIAARYSAYTWEAADRALCLGHSQSLAAAC